MAWELNIVHYGLLGSGDATLVVAREVAPLAGPVARVRSALIDGGRQQDGANLVAWIGVTLGGNPLNVIVVTHYDTDHVGGVIDLLTRGGLCNTVRLYDRGWPGNVIPANYPQYVQAINGLNPTTGNQLPFFAQLNRQRLTNAVDAEGVGPMALAGTYPLAIANLGPPAMPLGGFAAVTQPPDALLGTELLWAGVLGGPPVGAPTLACLAANSYILHPANPGPTGPVGGLGVDVENERSLAFVVRFNNFRYYVGGDIETAQEQHIQDMLNQNNNAPGRVLAMKTSHHGANTATARAFVDRLRPEAALVSCGHGNQYMHPAQQTVNVLDGFAGGALPHGGGTPPNRPISYYLTGYQVLHPNLQTLGGPPSETAGDPLANPPLVSTIGLTVSAAQSNSHPCGQHYLGVQAAANAVYIALTGNPNAAVAQAAAEATMAQGEPVAAAAIAVATATALAALTITLIGNAATGALAANPVTAATIATAVTNAAIGAGVNQAIAGAAGAAAGAASSDGSAVAVNAAVAAALLAVNNLAANGPAATLHVNGNTVANVPGLFNVIFNDANFMGPQPRVVNHF